ncbi:uncharacterized protein LOC122278594 [Carya illinoinensis]|uniref:uncharacterized protein LOC122278594 n=1 Tax=Carya illinoinensis TaxID=32201 RepID=UPI001C719E24|nr:uncharacterized protein LOC122278594 [Carya illinoinensis]
MEEQWRKLRLTEEEVCDIVVGEEVPEELRHKAKCNIVGKIWMERRVSATVVENTMGRVWRISQKARFQEVGINMFVIQFANEADKIRVMDGRPWLFDNYMFVLMPMNGDIPPQRMDFTKERMWIQLLEMPLVGMNEGEGTRIGNTIGEVVEVETQVDGSGWGCFLRVLLVMDLSKPIARGRTISVKGVKYWIPLRYEKLPHLCFQCGCIIHRKGSCVEKTDGSRDQFGSWLRAGPRIGLSTTYKDKERGEGRRNKMVVMDVVQTESDTHEVRKEREELAVKVMREGDMINEGVVQEAGEGLTEVLVQEGEVLANKIHNGQKPAGEVSVVEVSEVEVVDNGGRGSWKRKARGIGNEGLVKIPGSQERKRKCNYEKKGREKKVRKNEEGQKGEVEDNLSLQEVEAAEQPHLYQ